MRLPNGRPKSVKYTSTLKEIANWSQDKTVSLPQVQRGFVWRPSQIEDLWDSVLRGYPIGSFVLTPHRNNFSRFELLDGQQRATAIALGFAKESFRQIHESIRVFIDLEPPNADDDRRFVFRVITRSHPWGYKRIDNRVETLYSYL
jgi:hypothetical protein